MKALEAANYLKRVGNPEYPCLGLSTLGTDMLRGKKTLSLAIPELKSAEPERTKREKKKVISARGEIRERVLYGSDEELFEHLRELRAELAAKKRVPAYCILPDATLREFAEKRPISVPEAALIRGVGNAKLRTIVPFFLEAVRNWSN